MTTRSKLPPTVYLLGLTIFSLVTAEFMVAGMMPALAAAFSVSLAQVGNLIALYALGMALGGPPVTVLLLSRGISNQRALVGLLAVYVLAGALAAAAPTYTVLALARIVMGVSSAACIGLCMTLCAGLVSLQDRGRAISVVLAGLMLSPVAGVPATAWVEHHYGWRALAQPLHRADQRRAADRKQGDGRGLGHRPTQPQSQRRNRQDATTCAGEPQHQAHAGPQQERQHPLTSRRSR